MVPRAFAIFKCISFVAGPCGLIIAGALGETVEMNLVFIPYGVLLIAVSFITMIIIPPLSSSRLKSKIQ